MKIVEPCFITDIEPTNTQDVEFDKEGMRRRRYQVPGNAQKFRRCRRKTDVGGVKREATD